MRRYSSRQNVSFGGGGEGAVRARGIVIIVLTVLLLGMLLAYFVLIRPGQSSNRELQERYLTAMQGELKSASNVAENLSRNGGWDAFVNVAKVRSCVYALSSLYQQYLSVGGPAIQGFGEITGENGLISVIDREYIPSLTEGGTRTGTVVTEIQTRLQTLMSQINPEET